ncbi:hypothetical protein PEBR_19348 [Penicillium brasilianum]|uniref:Uncharacterized protein n=1 Tax=Penicillium brasilianum TaxID=104259 RepID=A0A1S9RN77_PENBI|nr:hypothetical protein PEBR_19348 [Penicillium brasilianum]
MSTTTNSKTIEVIENLYKLPLKAVATVQLPEGSDSKEPKEKDCFLLKCRSYYDLQAYLFAGMKLPSSSDDYERLYPKENCAKLTEVDSGIYEVTKKGFLDIQKSCERFNREDFGYIPQVAGSVQTYSKNAIFLAGKLKEQVAVILDDKYEEESNRDKKFNDSKNACRSLLQLLQNRSSETAKSISDVITRIDGFQKETELNFEAVCFLKKEYRTGPVVDSLTKKEKLDKELKPFPPYCKYIHGQIEELNKEVEKNIKRRDEEYEIWKHSTIVASTSVLYIWCPAASVPVMSVFTDRAIKADAAWQAAKIALAQNKADITTLTALSVNITGLCVLFDDLSDKIAAAKEALHNIKELFDKQSQNFGDAIHMFSNADETIDESLFIQKLLLQDCIDRAIKAFEKVIKSAEDFKKTEFKVEPMPDVGPLPEQS